MMKQWKVYYTFNLKSEYGDRYDIVKAETSSLALCAMVEKLESIPNAGYKVTKIEPYEGE